MSPEARNVRARMTVNLSSSNPEPTTFLMGALATELENIRLALPPILSPGTSNQGNYIYKFCFII